MCGCAPWGPGGPWEGGGDDDDLLSPFAFLRGLYAFYLRKGDQPIEKHRAGPTLPTSCGNHTPSQSEGVSTWNTSLFTHTHTHTQWWRRGGLTKGPDELPLYSPGERVDEAGRRDSSEQHVVQEHDVEVPQPVVAPKIPQQVEAGDP